MCCHLRFILWSCGDVQQRDVRQSGAQKEIGPDTTGNVNVVGALDSLEEGSLRERAFRKPSQSVFAKSGADVLLRASVLGWPWRPTPTKKK